METEEEKNNNSQNEIKNIAIDENNPPENNESINANPINETTNNPEVLPEENINTNNEPEELDPPIKFRRKLLTTEEHKVYGNRIVEESKFDNEGENGLFEAFPRGVKISGFEINKKVTVKIKIINKSKYGERIQIISPKSEFFKLKYTKIY